MKKFVLTLVVLIASSVVSFAQNSVGFPGMKITDRNGNVIQSVPSVNSNVVYQNGYTRSDGTRVRGHYKTRSNSTNWDNFSTVGNVNTYTGCSGSVARDYSAGASNYGGGRTIHTGSRGGQYYINSRGNKTYVPKRRSASIW